MLKIQFSLLLLLATQFQLTATMASPFDGGTTDNADEEGAFNCATLPPALWCVSEKVQEKCGFTEKCKEYATAVRNQPVHITLIYESLCPASQQFIINKLYNDVYRRFKNAVRIELIPNGNAIVLKNGTISCQHGPEECRINKWESCAIHYMQEPFLFIHCLESLIANGMGLEEAIKQCNSRLHPPPDVYDQILHCFNGPEGDRLQKADSQKTANIWPDQHNFVPWILVNNASFQSQQFLAYNLPALICQSYIGSAGIAENCGIFQESTTANYEKSE